MKRSKHGNRGYDVGETCSVVHCAALLMAQTSCPAPICRNSKALRPIRPTGPVAGERANASKGTAACLQVHGWTNTDGPWPTTASQRWCFSVPIAGSKMTGVHPKRLKSAIPMERVQTCTTVYTHKPQPNEQGGAQVQKSTESTERWAWTTVGSILILWLLNPTIKSPDGLEMLRLTQQWLGQPN